MKNYCRNCECYKDFRKIFGNNIFHEIQRFICCKCGYEFRSVYTRKKRVFETIYCPRVFYIIRLDKVIV